MKKKIKNFTKSLIRKFGWRLEKIRQNNFYNLEKPNLELINALINCRGVIHVGAHRGEEAPVYEWFGKKVLWFEANPYIFDDLEDNIYKYKYQKAYKALLLDDKKINVKFNLSNNDFASSSIYNFGKLSEGKDSIWPEKNLKMIKSINIKSNTFDNLVKEKNIEIKDYDHWVIDVQGSELLFLIGAEKSLSQCNSIYIEVSNDQIYQNGSKWTEVKNFLSKLDFKQITKMNSNHMDVLFVKNSS